MWQNTFVPTVYDHEWPIKRTKVRKKVHSEVGRLLLGFAH